MSNKLIALLLTPIAWLYGLGARLRNAMFNTGFIRNISFDLPVIGIGNLSVGGTGKTPHTEFLIQLLRPYIQIATLSRGYKRKTQGFRLVQLSSHVYESGDEPLQFKRKFSDITVAVSEDRVNGIAQLLMINPEIKTILLDDAFQHRSVTPNLNILLTEYDKPFTKDQLLPAGRLREPRSSYKRADIIIITKCPKELTNLEKEVWTKNIKPLVHQRLFFSHYEYGTPYFIWSPTYQIPLSKKLDVLLVSGIARNDYLMQYLKKMANSVTMLAFPDHHDYSKEDIGYIRSTFDEMEGEYKLILTTEKDAMRLDLHRTFFLETGTPIYALPIKVAFDGGNEYFEKSIIDFLMNFKV